MTLSLSLWERDRRERESINTSVVFGSLVCCIGLEWLDLGKSYMIGGSVFVSLKEGRVRKEGEGKKSEWWWWHLMRHGTYLSAVQKERKGEMLPSRKENKREGKLIKYIYFLIGNNLKIKRKLRCRWCFVTLLFIIDYYYIWCMNWIKAYQVWVWLNCVGVCVFVSATWGWVGFCICNSVTNV